MATYGTDLVLLATGSDAESGTWVEFEAPYDAGGIPGIDPENYIQGSNSQSQAMGNKFTVGFSVAFDAGSDISGSFAPGDVVLAWVFFIAGSNLYDYATTGGHRFGISADSVGSPSGLDMWFISGDDRPPNPYGGWWNVAIDPTITPDATVTGGNGGVYWYFGSILEGMRAKIAKGTPHAVDVMRMGRGEIYCTGTDATFTLMAAQNDLNANRWGLLQDTGGGAFLWKGLMSLGQSGTSTTFTDSNKTIVVDDTAKVTRPFNKIEIRNASSSISWTNITITARGTVSPGQFEMVENATTMDMTGCAFNAMDSFKFLSNATLTSCNFIKCSQIIQSGATFNSCNFEALYSGSSVVSTHLSGITDCSFTSGGTGNHAVELTSIGDGSMDWNNTLTGYVTGVATSPAATGTTGNEAIYVNVASGTLDINVGAGYTIPSIRSAGAIVNVLAGQVTTTITVSDINDSSLVVGARVLVEAFSGGSENYRESVSIVDDGLGTATVTHTTHGLSTGKKVRILGADQTEYNGVKTITATTANAYTFTTTGTPTTPATGTITSTTVFIDDITDAIGEISDTRSFITNQPVRGRVRRATSGTLYKTSPISATISNTSGLSLSIQMIPDE